MKNQTLNKLLLLLCTSIFFGHLSFYGQEVVKNDSLTVLDKLDSLVIDREFSDWSVRVFSNYKDQNFTLENNGAKAKFYPNNRSGIGLGFATKKLILDLAINIQQRKKEVTKRFDLQGSVLAKDRHVFDFFLQNYRGFNAENNVGEPFEFRKDIKSSTIGLNYIYLFNYKDFSMATMRSGRMFNNKTSTSFGLGVFLIYNDISGNSSILSESLIPHFNEQARISNFNRFSGGVQFSFSTMFALPRNFFASLSVNPGVGLQYSDIETEITSYSSENPVVYKLGLFAAIGYNAEKYYVNVNFGRGYYTSDLGFDNIGLFNLTKAKIVFGYKLWKDKKRPSILKAF